MLTVHLFDSHVDCLLALVRLFVLDIPFDHLLPYVEVDSILNHYCAVQVSLSHVKILLDSLVGLLGSFHQLIIFTQLLANNFLQFFDPLHPAAP